MVRLNHVDNAANKLRELAERWVDQLVLKDLSLSEAYIDGRIAVALIVDVGLGTPLGAP